MMFKGKIWGFIFVVLAVMVILSGCESGSSGDSADVVYNFAGSVGKGDFINVDINISKGEYNYSNRITDDTESGTFEEEGENFYKLDSGDYFFLLKDEVLIATNKEGLSGEKIITALKASNSEYSSEIENTYNIITSLEGASGTVTINNDNTAYINLDGDGVFTAPYSFNDDFKVIEIVEDANQFRHYGIFLNGEIGIFDSYWREDPANDPWTGDGMSILVKQDSSVELTDFVGSYNFVDVDGQIGTITLENAISDTIRVSVEIVGEPEGINDHLIEGINKNSGLFTFDTDITGEGNASWAMMLLPGESNIIVIGTKDPKVFGMITDDKDPDYNSGDVAGGIFIGIEQ